MSLQCDSHIGCRPPSSRFQAGFGPRSFRWHREAAVSRLASKQNAQMPFLSNRLRRHFSLPHAVTEICSTLHSAYSAGDDSIAILLSIPAICPPASSARLFSLRLLSRFLEGRPCPGDSPSGQTLQAHWSTFSDAYSLNGLGLPHRAYFSDHLTGFLLARDQPRYE